MKTQETIEILQVIAAAQQGCAPVKLQIGEAFDGTCEDGNVYISDCPAKIVEELRKAGYILQMSKGFLCVAYRESSQ